MSLPSSRIIGARSDVWNGKKIPLFKSDGTRPSPVSPSDSNQLVIGINALTTMRIRRGPIDAVFISDGETVIQISGDASGGGGSVQRYRIKGSINDGAGLPLAGSPIMDGTTLTCLTWDGTTLGTTDVLVARPPLLRSTLTTRSADGIDYSFSYTGTAKVQRTATITNPASTYDTETQIVVPHYLAGDEIFAMSVPVANGGTGVASVTWLDQNVDSRYWQSVSVAPPP